MADIAVASFPTVPTKKARSKRALKQKNSSSNDANILAGTTVSPTTFAPADDLAGKENHVSLSQPRPQKKSTKGTSKSSKQSFEKELLEMQEKLQKLSIEKKQTEDLLKEQEDLLKMKDQELENRGLEQEKLQIELKKLQKLKEFKPSMNLPIIQSLRDKGQENKDNKKKRPSPSYVLWCKDHWNEVKNSNPDAEFKEISNILGAKWKTISAEEKKPYEEQYQAEKEAYLKIVEIEKREKEAMKLFEEEQKQKTAMVLLEEYIQFKQEADKETKKTKKEKDPLKPKHPLSAYFVYANERRSFLLAENRNILEVSKLIGEEWRNMNEKQRASYEEMAKKNKENYVKEMEIYKEKKEEEAMSLRMEEEELMKLHKHEALNLLKKKERTNNIIKKTKENRQKKKEVKKVDPNKPKRPASSYLLFSKEVRKSLLEERPGINNSTLHALISMKWKELNEQDKKTWNEKAFEAMEIYKKELEEYNKSVADMSEGSTDLVEQRKE